ncbi:MAG: DUF4270 family protein [Vicingaceae bacterium]
MNKHIVFTSMRKVLFLSASFLIILQGCKKEGELNPDFAEDTSSNQFTDSLQVTARTVEGDSIFADQIATGLVGVYKDSVFGTSHSATYVQPLLPSNAVVFGENDETFRTDSIVLCLEYDGMFGDTVPQTFEVFRIDEVLSSDKDYPSNYSAQTISNVAGNRTFIPRVNQNLIINSPNASGEIDTIEVLPQLRIKLDRAIGDEILAQSGLSAVDNNTNFTSFFKGLKIQAAQASALSNNEKSILYFALTASNTKMSIYYTATNSQGDSTKKVVDFPINSSSTRFNTFEHDYTNGALSSVLQQNSQDPPFTYVQAMGGVQTRIKFPGLEGLKTENVIVNKAELELPVANGSYAKFGKAEKLVLAAQDENNQLQFIPDFFEGSVYFGGNFDESKQHYTFNITRYIQGLISGTESKDELTVLVSGGAIKAERVVLLGPTQANERIKLNLYFSNTQ